MTTITVAYGDGIGPDIMEAALIVLREAGAQLTIETIEVGERVYNMGGELGILPYAWDSLERSRILFKGPTLAPQPDHEDVGAAILKKLFPEDGKKFERYCYLSEPFAIGISDVPIQSDTHTLIAAAHAYISEPFCLFEPLPFAQSADPSPALLASIFLLMHVGQQISAALVHNAWLKTIEDSVKAEEVGARAFAESVAERLGQKPKGKIFNLNQEISAA